MRTSLDNTKLQELALSLSQYGQLNPIYVHGTPGEYELIAGHRRTAAAELLGWTHIEARIVSRDAPALWAMAWTENEARDGIAVTDKARWLSAMKQRNGWTQAQTAEILHMAQSQVSEILATLEYSPRLTEALEAGAISYGAARAIHRVTDADYQAYLIDQAAEFGCSARTAEEWYRQWRLSKLPPPDPTPDADAPQLADSGPATLMQICAGCHNASRYGLQLLPLCPTCYDAATAATSAIP